MDHASPEKLVADLTALVSRQSLRGRAFEGCSKWLHDPENDGPGGLSGRAAGEILPRFKSSSLVFDHGLLSHPFVETRLDLCVRDTSGTALNDLRPVCYYRLITLLDGTVDDDYFVIEVPFQQEADGGP